MSKRKAYSPFNQKTSSFYDCKNFKTCSHVLITPLKDQKPTKMLFGGDAKHRSPAKTNRDYKKRKIISIFEESSPPTAIKLNRT